MVGADTLEVRKAQDHDAHIGHIGELGEVPLGGPEEPASPTERGPYA